MLDVQQKATFNGTSTIDGTICERYSASIDVLNPEDITINRFIANKDKYRDNREECQKDEAEFETVIYDAQAEMLQEDSNHE